MERDTLVHTHLRKNEINQHKQPFANNFTHRLFIASGQSRSPGTEYTLCSFKLVSINLQLPFSYSTYTHKLITPSDWLRVVAATAIAVADKQAISREWTRFEHETWPHKINSCTIYANAICNIAHTCCKRLSCHSMLNEMLKSTLHLKNYREREKNGPFYCNMKSNCHCQANRKLLRERVKFEIYSEILHSQFTWIEMDARHLTLNLPFITFWIWKVPLLPIALVFPLAHKEEIAHQCVTFNGSP